MPAAKLARVMFDEAHSEAWTIRPELAAAIAPAHPEDSSYARAAAALAERDFIVEVNAGEPLTPRRSRGCDVLVIAHPSEPEWERTTGTGSPRLSAGELDAIEAFVREGGGLVVLGETEQAEVREQPQRAAGALRAAPGERHRSGLRAPSRRAELGAG